MRSLTAVVGWFAILGACGDDGSAPATLVSVTPAVDCPDGGTRIATGLDDNGNGVLDDGEIDQTSNVCNGGTGPAPVVALVSTTQLPQGDATCSQGGVRIDSGIDDGANGGTAGDGVLQAGEVLSSQYVCSGSNAWFPGTLVAPGTPAGAFTIDTGGGNGTTTGGDGGAINVSIAPGTLGGHIKMFDTGAVTPVVTVPALTFNAGAVPLVVSADRTVSVFADTATGLASADEYFLVLDDRTLYKDVGGVATEVTGIDIQAGRTLTLGHNEGAGSWTRVDLKRDVRNAGTLRSALQSDGKSGGSLYLFASNILCASGSLVTAAGQNATGSAGGEGGYIGLTAYGAMTLQGTITATGGNGSSGGAGRNVSATAYRGGLWNTGAITTSGGAGATTAGGDAGSIVLTSGVRSLTNSGSLTASGGLGVTAGGASLLVSLRVDDWGDVVNTGTITATGATCSATNCSGGAGGGVLLHTDAGAITSAAAITTVGGAGMGTGNGGGGGSVSMMATDVGNEGSLTNAEPLAGSVIISSSITTRGGAGGIGGIGGDLNVTVNVTRVPQGQEIVFYGVTDVRTVGGMAPGGTAGDGGTITLESQMANQPNGPGGAVINEARMDTRGGDGATGGYGGSVFMRTQMQRFFPGAVFERASNTDVIDVRAGASTADAITGASAGVVYVVGNQAVHNAGAIDSRGGPVSGANATGGAGYWIELEALVGPVTNTGALTTAGGAATGSGSIGGRGELIRLKGSPVTNSGALSVAGANGQMVGGRGGEIFLESAPLGPTANTGTLSVNGGTGVTNGASGRAVIDGAEVAP